MIPQQFQAPTLLFQSSRSTLSTAEQQKALSLQLQIPFTSQFVSNHAGTGMMMSKGEASAITPLDHDILCGKGKICAMHPGSLYYKTMISQYAVSYSIAETRLDS